ncbi:MAG TPA: GNAT family N-acetyltransferase [Actinomycetes bacterium]|nr:GNAT family N-acetyltransferase [Actinomycetes bacterium]
MGTSTRARWTLHAASFERAPSFDWDWWQQVNAHSLGWVCARNDDRLVGWVNVAWDGGVHAFLIDTIVDSAFRRQGIATEMVRHATEQARTSGCEWLHVDFDEHLRSFYWEACGFTATDAGLIAL